MIGHALAFLCGDLLARETASRSRRDLGALFFDGAWDKPIA